MAYTTINKPIDYFNTVTYTGSASNQTVNTNFSPEFVWVKNRIRANEHVLFDIVRGSGNELQSNNTNAENNTSPDILTINSDSFTVEGSINRVNTTLDSSTYVAWHWLGGGTAVSNTDGSITSTVSANTTSGFSIVSYTGTGANATVGHGLGSVPKMIIIKNRDVVRTWVVYHHSIGNTKGLHLDTTAAETTDSTFFNNTTPTSSVFSIGAQGDTNRSSENLIAYCFAEKKGFSKFGSYTGNGNADGPMLYTGFKPAWVMIKRATGGNGNWGIWDNKRNIFNVSNSIQRADTSDAEVTLSPNNDIDILSNGFKIRSTTGLANLSGDEYIYMAFAESPFTTSTGVPTTAR
jgi:hypothetical protein